MTPASSAIANVLAAPKLRFLAEFTVNTSREVDEVVTRVEDGKTITETTKVKRNILVPFGLKMLSRMEREDLDVERSVWWSRYVERGILPTALVNKIYSNNGGILDHVDQVILTEYQAQFMGAEVELKRLEVNEPTNKPALEAARLEFMRLRNAIMRIQSDNAVFFENTAEAKARNKVVEWVLLHMSYYRPTKEDGSDGEWTPFFPGDTTEAKMAAFDAMTESGNELWDKARSALEFLSVFCADGGNADPAKIADYLGTIEAERKAAEAAAAPAPVTP